MNERGSATVEAAFGIVALLSVVSIVFIGVGAALAKGYACADAREVARSVSIGREAPPTTSTIDWFNDGEWVTVNAKRKISAGHLIGQKHVECTIRTRDENNM